MAQVFHPATNSLARFTFYGGAFVAGAIIWASVLFVRSGFNTGVNNPLGQPVPFSHEHHVGGLGLDCRYCHTSVEDSSYAGMPPTATCMTCHSQVWKDSPVLAPVRQSLAQNQPLQWNRVYVLPGFVYFDHSIHVQHGVGCATCHGRVDQMPLTFKAEEVTMSWCLTCHKNPAPNLRPADQVFNMAYQTPPNQAALGQQLMRQYHIDTSVLTDCSTCHR
ncbi:MAG TPA: cytochrome c3 family protein [Thermomicrobiales bacterium]|nr:cytochrome c3 family protein [Thermomicrobiales bacterium]